MSLALKLPIETKYFLHDTMLDIVSSAKYLGVTISDDLSWSTHIDNITKSANKTLGFLKRNIRVHNKDLKSVAYRTLVRPQLEYASTVCPPPPPPTHTHKIQDTRYKNLYYEFSAHIGAHIGMA